MKVDLKLKVLTALKKIPRGRVTTYGELARIFHTSPRAIGRIMAGNKEPEKYPCYKVVLSSGAAGRYSAGGEKRKIQLLVKDGIQIINGKIGRRYFWRFR